MPQQPARGDRALVDAGIVQRQMQVELLRCGPPDSLQDVAELHAAVERVDPSNDGTGLGIKRREEIGRAMADAVVGVALQLPRAHGIAACLDGGLQVHARHQCPRGRMQVGPDDVAHLVLEANRPGCTGHLRAPNLGPQ